MLLCAPRKGATGLLGGYGLRARVLPDLLRSLMVASQPGRDEDAKFHTLSPKI